MKGRSRSSGSKVGIMDGLKVWGQELVDSNDT